MSLHSPSLMSHDKLDAKASGNRSIKKTSHSIGNSSATHQRRPSVGSSFNDDSSRRDSSGKFSSSNNKEDVIPHYLRASTGSCHDFCKYGKKQTVEEKPWQSYSKRVAKTPSSNLRSKEHTISAEKSMKVTEGKHKAPQDIEVETHAEDLKPSPISKTISQNLSEIMDTEVSLPPKEVEQSCENLGTAKDVLETELKTGNMLQPKTISMEASPSTDTSEGNHKKGRIITKVRDGKLPQASKPSRSLDASQGKLRRSKKHSDMKDMETVAEPKALQKTGLRSSGNLPSSMVSTNKIRNLTARKIINSKLVPKDQNIIQKAVSVQKPKNEKVSVKTLYATEKDTLKALAKPIRNRGITASSHKQDPIEEDTKECNQHDWEEEKGEKDEERTGGIDVAATKPILRNKDASKGKRKEGVESKITRTVRKGASILSKDKDSSPMKLNFRRGKVIQLHSDNNTPIRLKFRRGRILLGNKDGMGNVKKLIKKKGVADDKDVADHSTKRVVLRHQDVQDKKIDPGLLNIVIEETATKLAESRKSKVKALVGAFETVISLQEILRPSNVAHFRL